MNLKYILNIIVYYLLSCYLNQLAIADEWVYTWTSKNNKIHYYSDKPLNLIPESSNYILINKSNLFNNSKINTYNNKYQKNTYDNYTNNNDDNKNQDEYDKQYQDFKTQNCEIAKKNLHIAQDTNNLSKKDKNSVIQNYQNDINKYCN